MSDTRLSRIENAILDCLRSSTGSSFSYKVIIAVVWPGVPDHTRFNSLRVHVSNIRRKIGRESILTAPDGYIAGATGGVVPAPNVDLSSPAL